MQVIDPFNIAGIVGDWKRHFTVAESEAFDKLYVEKMADIDLQLEFEPHRQE